MHTRDPFRFSAHRRRLVTGLLAACATLAIAAGALAQASTGIVRVAPTGSDVADCGAVLSPCQTLQFAVDQFPLPGAGTLLVAAGTYTSTDPDRVLRVTRRRIHIDGGYAADFSSRDPDGFPVVIDGENARKGILADCPVPVVDDCHLTLTGLTLTRGRAGVDIGSLGAFGGALDAFATNVLIVDVDVTNSRAQGLDSSTGLPGDGGGGGLSFRSSTAFLSDVHFSGNVAQGGAGSGSAPRGGLGVGGAIFSIDSSVNMNHVSADGNMALGGDAPSAVGNQGIQRADGLGGFWSLIESSGAASDLSASNNHAEGGDAATLGGLGLGGAIFIQIVSRATLQRIDLRDNQAIGGAGGDSLGAGGGIFSEDAVVEIDASTIIDNRVEGGNAVGAMGGTAIGGGLCINSALPQANLMNVTNSIVASNDVVAGSGTAPGFAFGGGIFVQCPQGPGICSSASASVTLNLDHVTLAENTVTNATFNQGAALYVSQESVANSTHAIVSGHATPVTMDDRGEAILTFGATSFETTLYDGNTLRNFTAPGGSFSDVNPLSGSPAYLDPQGSPADYHIGASSAAIGQAPNSSRTRDLDGEARPEPTFGASDVGADEFHMTPSPVVSDGGLFASVFDNGKLLHVDAATGRGHPVGIAPVGLVGLSALGDRLFGLGATDQLIEFDPTSAAVLGVTTPGIALGDEGALAFDSNGNGFAVRGDTTPSELWSFDPAGGSPLQLNANLGDSFDGLAFDAGDDLFGMSESLSLFDVDAGGGAPQLIGSTGLSGPGLAGMAFSDQGTLFAAVANQLYEIDPGDGTPTSVGAIEVDGFGASGVSGLAFVPEPRALAAGAAAIATLAALRIRRKTRRA